MADNYEEYKLFCAQVPKCELHVHIEGTLEVAQARMFAERNGLPIPKEFPIGENGYPFYDLPSFLKVYYASMSCLQKPIDFSDLAFAYLTKAHSQNVLHTEMFFDPQAHTSRGIPFDSVISGLQDGIDRAKKEFGISTGLIMCFLRDHSAASAAETLDALLASPYRSAVIGIGLDSDEKDNPPMKFADTFAKAKAEGFRITMHCDADQINTIEHIRQAIFEIGVERIDHGVHLAEDADLMAEVIKRGIGLTCCPLAYSKVCADFKSPEITSLARGGVKVSINSDDPAYFDGYIQECLLKMHEGGWKIEDVALSQKHALEISWLAKDKKEAMLQKFDAFMQAWPGIAAAK